MKTKNLIILIIILTLGLTVLISMGDVSAKAIVDSNLNDEDLEEGTYNNIQDAVDSGEEEIILEKGIYRGEENTNLEINRDITIKSEKLNDAVFVLDEKDKGNVFTFKKGYHNNPKVFLYNLKFVSNINNLESTQDGGFIAAYNLKSIKILNCRFINGYATNGGSIYLYYNNKTVVEDCVFEKSRAEDYGGAIYYTNTEPNYDDRGEDPGLKLINNTYKKNYCR